MRYSDAARLFIAMALAGLTACTTPPERDFGYLRAGDSQDITEHTIYLAKQSEAITGQPFVPGNAAQLLRDGDQTFPAMLASIKKAKHYIYLESFTFDDKAGKRFALALVNRRKAGVKVDLIYDAFGSSDTPSGIFDYLRQKGVRLTEYNPIDAADVITGDVNHRDHRKLLIVDGKDAFVGGVNISAVYLLKRNFRNNFYPDDDKRADTHLRWRDTHIKIMGPVIDRFVQLYKNTWLEQSGNTKAFSTFATDKQTRGDLAIEAIVGAPKDDHFSIYESLMMAVTLAQHSIDLTTGYFVPTPDLKTALIAAAHRGVAVTLLLPSTSDSDLALAAGHADYSDLLDAGVKIYELQGEVLHAKTAVIDGVWSTVGSSNLDWRSAAINNECNAVILGSKFGSQLQLIFADDLSHSKQITPEAWDDRPLEERFDEFKASLVDYFL